MALLALLAEHRRNVRGSFDILAITVDHRLRAESAAEAAMVASFCGTRAITHRTLAWEGDKPAAGLAAAAREARHALLLAAARNAGARLVLAGHTADDVAETVLMRSRRGTGRGLAGIAPATLLDGSVWLVRPLLAQRRADLRTLLTQAGIIWVDDPTNERDEAERVGARRRLAAEPSLVTAMLSLAHETAQRRIDEGERAARLIDRHAHRPAPGVLRIEPALAQAADRDAALLALRLLLATSGGREHMPDARRAGALLQRLGSGEAFRAALSGAVLDVRRSGIVLHRELRAGWTGRTTLTPGAIWDGRYRLHGAHESVTVAALGRQRAAALLAEGTQDDPPRSLVLAALAAVPALRSDADAPGMGDRPEVFRGSGLAPGEGPRLLPLAAPYARYLPSFDLAPATALARLLDAPLPPEPPWASHNAA